MGENGYSFEYVQCGYLQGAQFEMKLRKKTMPHRDLRVTSQISVSRNPREEVIYRAASRGEEGQGEHLGEYVSTFQRKDRKETVKELQKEHEEKLVVRGVEMEVRNNEDSTGRYHRPARVSLLTETL